MKKDNIIRPGGLKGREVLNRMKELMGNTSINENTNNSVIELTKEGPDGKIYAVVRENREYFIKVTDKRDNLISEDFNYIGGLQNKKDKSYPSYAKAIKQLNLKFMSLNEAYNGSSSINTFKNDNLLNEHHPMNPEAKLSATKGVGDADEYVVDKKGTELDYDAKEDKENHGDNVATGKADNFEEVKLNETEMAIDEMIEGKVEEEVVEEEITETKKGYSIARAIQEMDEIVESIDPNSELNGILEKLNESDQETILNILKKKD